MIIVSLQISLIYLSISVLLIGVQLNELFGFQAFRKTYQFMMPEEV